MIPNARRLAIGVVAAALAAAALPSTALGGPVEEAVEHLGHCRAWADPPSPGDRLVGAGGASCGFVHEEIVGAVCLVYNGVTIGPSCKAFRSSDGDASGTTNPTKCLPGLWATQVIVTHVQGPDTEVVSGQVLLTCVPPQD